MKLDSLQDVFYDQLKDVYSAEQQFMQALPNMRESAASPALESIFNKHQEETEKHFVAVRNMLNHVDVNPTSTECAAMKGFINEFEELVSQEGDPNAKDAAIIAITQKMEHFLIATYGALRTWATLLGHNEMATHLNALLDQQYDFDNALGRLAENSLNQVAM